MYVVGSPVHLTASFADATGAPVDPAAVALILTDPLGAPVAPLAAVKDAAGVYHYDYTPTLAGTYQWYFAGTGANAATQEPDIFTVSAATTGNIVSLADAKAQLNKTSTVDDAELLGYIRAATAIVNRNCGYSVATPFTETVYGRADGYGRTALLLSRTPVMSVSAVTSTQIGYSPWDLSSLQIDGEAGIVYLGNYFTFGGALSVSYMAGRGSVPSTLRLACLLLVQWLWDTQHGGGASAAGMGGDDMTEADDGNSYPTRAYLLMRDSPHYAPPGIA